MKRIQLSAIAMIFSSLFATQAMATDAQLSNDAYEVVTESGRFAKDVFSSNYPSPQVESLTSAQVRMELVEAINKGNVIVSESGQLANEVFSANYDIRNNASKSREEVRAELTAAIENGLLDKHISF
ncbi:MAG: hypothetical protein GX844_07275 [Alcaligenaceae bacterium]|jgi:hypothetical protein|nr:hypothetical protein [Alcaligenaceae bacterium]